MDLNKQSLLPYISFKTSRSGGKGGQNVNKVSTKVELLFDLSSVPFFTEPEKMRISKKLQSRFQGDNLIQLIDQSTRSQLQNKEAALDKLIFLLKNALIESKPRKATKPSFKSKQNRLKAKRLQALKKLNRTLKGF